MFERMDEDGSGTLSTDELSEGLASLGYQVSKKGQSTHSFAREHYR